ncbi:MAG: hypothetical protein ACREKH_19000 [Candidatus Rokuibacteriota bacterium]
MRPTVVALALASLLVLAGPAAAELCTIDPVPASTLLVPYFEVDLTNQDGFTTLFSINNASPEPTLAHVTLWTDWSIPTIDFDVYLTGFDVQSFNLRDLFTSGALPQTAPDDEISNRGFFSTPHAVLPGCAGNLPIGHLPPILRELIDQAHTGGAVSFFNGRCAGQNYGDDIARGYITIDQVEACSTLFPNSPGYFGPGGVAGYGNGLWGDVFYVDPANDFAQGVTAVHVEAAPPGFFAPGDYTFYGRHVAFTGVDRREPLPTTFLTRYLAGGVLAGGTDILCWRDSKANPQPRVCNTGPPPPMPLGLTQAVFFDEEENPLVEQQPPPISPLPPPFEGLPCMLEAERAVLSSFPYDLVAGWLYLNLNNSTGSPADPVAQAWVTTLINAEGRYAVGLDAVAFDSACEPMTGFIPLPPD